MKKLLSVLLTLCLVTLLGAALAEADEPQMSWSDFADMVGEDWGSTWFTNQYWNVGFLLPDVFTAQELTDELREQGTIACYTIGEDTAKLVVIGQDLPDGVETIDAYHSYLLDNGYIDATIVSLNGYRCILCSDASNDQTIAIRFYEDQTMLLLACSPASNESVQHIAQIITASLMNYDDALAMMK